ncbi:Ig-like domain-containing protein, partial [Candidatus Latescibacterota bacterium]
ITTPTNVTFSSDVGDIEKFAQSDSTTGQASVNFTSGVVGTATITANVGEATGTITVIMIPGAPQSVELSFNPTSVGVQGSGRNETLLITADVKDNKNNPVGDGHLVKFEMVGGFDTDAQLSPHGADNHESEPVPTVNGSARVSFHAGTRSGTVRIKATVLDEDGNPLATEIKSESTQFMVYSGPAYLDMTDVSDPFTESRMKLYGGPLNIYAGAIGNPENQSTITVTIGDKYKNPVPEGTAVYFTTTGGYVTTDTGFTDKDGIATATLYSSNPFPTRTNSSAVANPNYAKYGDPETFPMPLNQSILTYFDPDEDGIANNGFAIVSAYSEGIDHLGNEVSVWNYVPVIFSLDVSEFSLAAVPAAPDTLYRGASRTFEVTVHDSNKNPIVGGSEISFKTLAGNLSVTSITTNSPGEIKYYVDLTNDLDPLNDVPGATVVSAALTSPNGNTTASAGIYMSISTPPK